MTIKYLKNSIYNIDISKYNNNSHNSNNNNNLKFFLWVFLCGLFKVVWELISKTKPSLFSTFITVNYPYVVELLIISS